MRLLLAILLWTVIHDSQLIGKDVTVIPIDASFTSLRLDNQTYVWEDTSKSFTIEGVLKSNLPFTKNNSPSLNFAYANSYFWLRFELQNVDSVSRSLILEVENPHINKLQLHEVRRSKVLSGILTGDNVPFVQRPVAHPHFIFPISLQPYDTVTYFLWVDKHGEQVQAPLRLMSLQEYNSYNSSLHAFWGIMLGITFIFTLISLVFFFFNPGRLSFYFWCYSFSVFCFNTSHTGLGFQYFWPNWTWWQSAARPTFAFCIYIFILLFIRSFFEIRKKRLILNYYTLILLSGLLFLLLCMWSQNPLLGLFEHYWYHPEYYKGDMLLIFSKNINSYILLVLFSVLFIAFYEFFKERKLENLLLAFSFLMFILGALSILFIFSGVLPDTIITRNIPLLSNSLETVILLMLLGNRLKTIRKDNRKMSLEIQEQKLLGAQKIIEGQMKERQRLSQQLHDGMNLVLSNIRLRLSMLADKSKNDTQELQQLVQDLGIANEDLRQFSHALSPIIFDKYGLIDGIEELIEKTQQAHPDIAIHFDHDQFKPDQIPEFKLRTLYQVLQELLNNLVKHANATESNIAIHRDEKYVTLEVSDNGKGYDPKEQKEGIGLRNIESQVQLLFGEFKITSDSSGSKHIVQLPL